MSYNNENPDHEDVSHHGLSELMSEAERTAIETLLSETNASPAVAREEPLDSIFSAISHPGRRYVLTYLLRSDGYVTMSELVDYVMDRTSTENTDEQFRRKVTINLTHTHLPRLAENGFIDYNMERQLIMPTEKMELTAPYLKTALIQQKYLNKALEP